MLPEFDVALMDVSPDEKKEFELTFPVSITKKNQLANKKAIFSSTYIKKLGKWSYCQN